MVGCHSIDKVYLVVQEMDKAYLVFNKVTKCTWFLKKMETFCSSPEYVCGVSPCLAEVDFVGPIVLV